ncbi:MAG: hypothetical protein SGPRY_000095, partial [Prymnesium sp.]
MAGFGVLTAPMRLGLLFVGLLIDASKSAHALLIPLPTPSGVLVAGATGVNGFKGFGVAFGAAIGADDGTGGLAAGSDGTGLVACSSVRFGTLGKLKEDGIVAGCADCAEPAQWPSTVSWEAGPAGNVAFFAPRPDLRKACFGLGITLSPGGGGTLLPDLEVPALCWLSDLTGEGAKYDSASPQAAAVPLPGMTAAGKDKRTHVHSDGVDDIVPPPQRFQCSRALVFPPTAQRYSWRYVHLSMLMDRQNEMCTPSLR